MKPGAFVSMVAVALGLATAAGAAGAATIDVRTVDGDGGGTAYIFLEGEINYGDEAAFIDAALRVPKGFVVLSSPGGNVHAAIEIGKAVRLKGYRTAVLDGETCASACGLIWLGGNTRFMARNAQVGFHAVSLSNDPKRLADSVGNALVGAYLSQINMPTDAIAYITRAQPDDMRWLTVEDAREVGIEVSAVAPDMPGLPDPPDGPSGPGDPNGPILQPGHFEPGERPDPDVSDPDEVYGRDGRAAKDGVSSPSTPSAPRTGGRRTEPEA